MISGNGILDREMAVQQCQCQFQCHLWPAKIGVGEVSVLEGNPPGG